MFLKKPDNKIFSFLAAFILSNIIFFNLAHLLIKFWELPAREMILVYLFCISLFTMFFFKTKKILIHLAGGIPLKRLVSLALTAIILGIVFTLVFPHIFTSTVIIAPEIRGDKNIELLEVKANGHVVPVNHLAEGYGWDSSNSSVIASKNSRPMQIKISSPVNKPVSLLFSSSPESGTVIVTYGKNTDELLLTSVNSGETVYSFTTRYRNFLPWLFQVFITGIDILAFSIYAFILFLLQEKGQGLISDNKMLEKFPSHRTGLLILIFLSFAMHLLNILSVPLIMDVDSPSFLRGAIHLAQYGNFDGVSMFRGPGTTLLFAPVAAIFGRNPWGMKILLHLMAIGCVFLNYRLVWQISGKRWIAFVTGLVTLFIPDPYFFSNFVMSDLPNIFLASLFCTLLVSAMQTYKKRWIFASFITVSFAILLRSENLVLLGIGIIALAIPPFWEKINHITGNRPSNYTNKIFNRRLGMIALASLLAVVPVFWWSAHNLKNFGFFGMSNYAGEVFYTGWVYYAEASGYPFADQGSSAVQKINAAIEEYPVERLNSSGVPTGWNIYPSLIKAGYSSSQSFGLLNDAAKDSIQNNWRMTWDVLWVKLKDGLTPLVTHMVTFPLPGEAVTQREIEPQFFDAETLQIPGLIKIQKMVYTLFQKWYDHLYQFWIWLGLLAAYFSLQRKPTLVWGTLAAIMLTRIFIPDIMGKSDWRYTIAGIVIMQALTISWLSAIAYGVRAFAQRGKEKLV